MQNAFIGEVAERYDEDCADISTPAALAPMLDVLEELGGPALELAIGTGRVGLPLAARGVPVTGIELSGDMVAQPRRKPGGEALPVTVADTATTRVPDTYSLVHLVFNTPRTSSPRTSRWRASPTRPPISPREASSSSSRASRTCDVSPWCCRRAVRDR
ncbi:MAG: methyltransferase domain-containing protein [Propionibacteriaceae bacterium]